MRYCPQCGRETIMRTVDRRERRVCPDGACGFVFWNNPVPVVAVIVETTEGVVLAHHVSWAPGKFSIITGFLEAGEDPAATACRETREELGLTPRQPTLIGVYPFARSNQVLLAYHLVAEGDIILNEELDAFKIIPRNKMKAWPFGTGLAVADWLKMIGLTPGRDGALPGRTLEEKPSKI
ncbi:MAG: NUDIX domain-containing protein [Magnetococcales bacterium]|nr:NUDIX domain-containing protein [Magnetococcales bacterium]